MFCGLLEFAFSSPPRNKPGANFWHTMSMATPLDENQGPHMYMVVVFGSCVR